MSEGVTGRECFKCGAEIRPCYSAYNPWDEEFKLTWTPASDDEKNVSESDSGGKHPNRVTRVFCSRDCLDAFIQMDYSFPPRSLQAETDCSGDDHE